MKAYSKRTKLSGTLDVDFGYTGHYHHARSGLNLTLYRAYNPTLGRWINRDPIGEAGGVNLYSYVNNDPINLFDPLGLYDYNEAQTRKIFLVPAFIYATAGPIEGVLNIRDLSQGRGPYDFSWNKHVNGMGDGVASKYFDIWIGLE